MKKIVLIVLSLCLCLCLGAAMAETEAEFNQSCRKKIGSSTPLYQSSDSTGTETDVPVNFIRHGSLSGGTYVQVVRSQEGTDLDYVKYYGGAGYVKHTAVVDAMATVRLDNGSTVSVPEALTKDTDALVSYLNKNGSGKKYSAIAGSSTIHVSGGTTTSASASPAATTAPLELPEVTYTDENGDAQPVTIDVLGLAYSTIVMDDQALIVPTVSLTWETEAKPKKVIAIVNGGKPGKIAMIDSLGKKPGTIGELASGTVVAVLKVGSTYSRVLAGGMVGFVKTDALAFRANQAYPKAQTGMIDARATGEVQALASGKKGARQIGTLVTGTPVVVLEEGKTWSEIETGGLHCYVPTKQISLDGKVKTETVADAGSNSFVRVQGDQSTSAPQIQVVTDVPQTQTAQTQTQVVDYSGTDHHGKLLASDSNLVEYGAYKQDHNYAQGEDYESDDRYFFDEEY